MEAQLKAVETTGTVDNHSQLHLDNPLPIPGPARVKVIVMYTEESEDIEESEWLRVAASNPAFDFLKDSEEDIYTIADGVPFRDEK